jgi:AcrR family transcriptional regulator
MEPTDSPDLWHGTLSAHRAKTSDSILHAAMGIVALEGIAGLSMSALADAAGVSRQTLYKYFADVDAVLAGMAAAGSAGMAQLSDRIDAESDPREGLHVFVAAILEAASAGHPSPLALAAAVPASSREALRGHEQEAEVLVIGLLRRGRDTGVLRADLDPELDGRIIYRAAFSASDLAQEPGVDVPSLARHVSEDLLRMVAAPGVRSIRKRQQD